MGLNIPTPSVSSQAEVAAVGFLESSNSILQYGSTELKSSWTSFWDPGQSVEVLQAKVDFLAACPETDPSGADNLFLVLCAKSLRRIQYHIFEDPDCFDDAKLEHTGAAQPNGQPYKQYFTAGWYWTFDPTLPSSMRFTTPVVWAAG